MMEKIGIGGRMTAEAEATASAQITAAVGLTTRYEVECRGPDGRLKWIERFANLVVDEGLNDLLAVYAKATAYSAALYVGLKGTGTPVAGDTMASHAGWAEVTAYAEAARPTYNPGTVANKAVDNAASKAAFSINGPVTIAGAFIATDATKGGTVGKLYGAGNFTNPRTMDAGDTLNVTATLQTAAI